MFDTLLDLRFLKSTRKIAKLNKYVCLGLLGFTPALVYSEQIASGIEWQTTTLPDVKEGGFMNARLIAIKGSKDESKRLTYHLDKAPDWVKMTERGIMTYQPDYTKSGRYQVNVSVSDGNEKVTNSFELLVKDVNQLPVLQKIAPLSIKEGEKLNFTPKASDLDNDQISLKLRNAPKGMRIEGEQIIWVPSVTSSGEHSLEVVASDGKDEVNQLIIINVIDVNQAPTWKKGFSLPKAKEGQHYSILLPVSDVDGDALTFLYQGSIKGIEIVEDKLVYRPDFESAGDYTIAIVASDGNAQVEKTLTMVVENTNREPLWQTQELPLAKEGTAYNFQLSANDADAQVLRYTLTKAPEGLTVSDRGEIIWQPDFEASGDHEVMVNVSDAESDVSKKWVLSVENTNRAPVFDEKNLVQAKENEAYKAPIPAHDPDGQLLTFALVQGPKGLWLENGSIHWLPDFESAGNHELKILASDGDLSTEQQFSLAVENTNRLPVIDSDPVAFIAEGGEYQYQLNFYDEDGDTLNASLIKKPEGMTLVGKDILWRPDFESAGSVDVEILVVESGNAKAKAEQRFVIDVTNTNRLPIFQSIQTPKAKENKPFDINLKATDADGQVLSFSAVDVPYGMTVDTNGSVNWQPDFEQAGEYNLLFSVDDSEDQVTYELPISVENTNRSPNWITESLTQAKEDTPWQQLLESKDPDSDVLAFRLIQSPEGLLLNGNMLEWRPGFEQSGQHQVAIEVSDGDLNVRKTLKIEVENTNRAPEWPEFLEASLVLKENKPWSLALEAKDADLQPLKYRLASEVNGLTLKNNRLKWQPGFEQAGGYLVEVIVFDSEVDVPLSLSLQVDNTNRKPLITSQPLKNVAEAAEYRYQITGADPDLATIFDYELIDGPEGMEIIDGEISWQPDYESAGSHPVKVELSDGEASIFQTFNLLVNNTNRAPVFDTLPVEMVEETRTYQYRIEVSDPDRQPVVSKLKSAPKGMQLVNGVLSLSTDFNSAGVYPVILSVSDGELVTEQLFDVTVINKNRLPEFISKPELKAYEGVGYAYQLKAKDADEEKLRFNLLKAPEGMQLKDDKLVWQPNFNQKGVHNVSLSVTDGIDNTKQQFVLQVDNTNREPTFDSIQDQRVASGKLFSYPLVANDVDLSPVKFELIHAPEGMVISEENQLQWKAPKNTEGRFTVIVSASDGDLKVRRYFDLVVENFR